MVAPLRLGLGGRPDDLEALSLQVFEILRKYTNFPWPVMETQCQRAGVNPHRLTREGLPRIIDPIADSIARFGNVQKGLRVKIELRGLV